MNDMRVMWPLITQLWFNKHPEHDRNVTVTDLSSEEYWEISSSLGIEKGGTQAETYKRFIELNKGNENGIQILNQLPFRFESSARNVPKAFIYTGYKTQCRYDARQPVDEDEFWKRHGGRLIERDNNDGTVDTRCENYSVDQ